MLAEEAVWYKRKPTLTFFLFISIILFVISLVANFVPAVSRNSKIHEENGLFLLCLQIFTNCIAFCYMMLMLFRWFVNIFSHRQPKIWTIIADIAFCITSIAMTVVFLFFGDSALQKCAFWTGINLILNINELIIHLTHRRKANNQDLLVA